MAPKHDYYSLSEIGMATTTKHIRLKSFILQRRTFTHSAGAGGFRIIPKTFLSKMKANYFAKRDQKFEMIN